MVSRNHFAVFLGHCFDNNEFSCLTAMSISDTGQSLAMYGLIRRQYLNSHLNQSKLCPSLIIAASSHGLHTLTIQPSYSQQLYRRTNKGTNVASFSTVLMAATNENISGYYLTKTPLQNKAAGFTHEEREKLGLRGLFPAGEPQSLELKLEIAMENFRGKVPHI